MTDFGTVIFVPAGHSAYIYPNGEDPIAYLEAAPINAAVRVDERDGDTPA